MLTIGSASMETSIVIRRDSFGRSGKVSPAAGNPTKLRGSFLPGSKSVSGNKRDKW